MAPASPPQIAGFIFGKNMAPESGEKAKVAMTSPVTLEAPLTGGGGDSAKIAMTSPVTAEMGAGGRTSQGRGPHGSAGMCSGRARTGRRCEGCTSCLPRALCTPMPCTPPAPRCRWHLQGVFHHAFSVQQGDAAQAWWVLPRAGALCRVGHHHAVPAMPPCRLFRCAVCRYPPAIPGADPPPTPHPTPHPPSPKHTLLQ